MAASGEFHWPLTLCLSETNELLQRSTGIPGTVELILSLAANGVKLTPAGRLPRSLVRAGPCCVWLALGQPE
jgi:hypothetical protein